MLQEGDILLRKLQLSDKETVARLANNKKVWDNLRDYIPFPYSEQDAIDFILHIADEDPQFTFGISYKEELCGVIGLVPEKDAHLKTTEIGYWIGEPFWGKGITTHAVKCVVKYAFDVLDFQLITAGIFEYNTTSMRVLEKNGFTRKKILKKAVLKNGRRIDERFLIFFQ